MEEQSNDEEGQRCREGTGVEHEQHEEAEQEQDEEEEIAAIGIEIAAMKRQIISFGDDLDSIKTQVCHVDREYREAQAENQNLLEKIRRRTTATDSNNTNNPEDEPPLDPISVRLIGIQLASIMVYMGTLTKEITLEGKKVRQVSEKMFAKEEQIQQLERKQCQKIHQLESRRDLERERLEEMRRRQREEEKPEAEQEQQHQKQSQQQQQEEKEQNESNGNRT